MERQSERAMEQEQGKSVEECGSAGTWRWRILCRGEFVGKLVVEGEMTHENRGDDVWQASG